MQFKARPKLFWWKGIFRTIALLAAYSQIEPQEKVDHTALTRKKALNDNVTGKGNDLDHNPSDYDRVQFKELVIVVGWKALFCVVSNSFFPVWWCIRELCQKSSALGKYQQSTPPAVHTWLQGRAVHLFIGNQFGERITHSFIGCLIPCLFPVKRTT